MDGRRLGEELPPSCLLLLLFFAQVRSNATSTVGVEGEDFPSTWFESGSADANNTLKRK